VRSRLRAARIYESSATPFLYVNVAILGPAFSINISFYKYVFDFVSAESHIAITWNKGSIGTQSQDSGYIISSVSRHIDKFIDEYLRVNEEACAR